jgi:hypothetical protein
MSVSAAPAEFSGTIVYVGRHTHPEYGPVEVLGYQNTVVNLAQGPNAMLLHVPAVELSSANFLDPGETPYVLRDLVDSLRPVAWVGGGAPRGVEVFDHEVYTVVVAADPLDIPAALSRVPVARRPTLARELLDFYAETFPGYPVVVCCFDNAEARHAAPLLIWYRPKFADRLTAPAVQASTGAPPDPEARPDHRVVFGFDDPPEGWGVPVQYRREPGPGPLGPFLPWRVIGREVIGELVRNGDFVLSLADARAGRIDRLARLTADGEQAPLTASAGAGGGAARPWLRPLLVTVAVVLLALFCGWFLIWGP